MSCDLLTKMRLLLTLALLLHLLSSLHSASLAADAVRASPRTWADLSWKVMIPPNHLGVALHATLHFPAQYFFLLSHSPYLK